MMEKTFQKNYMTNLVLLSKRQVAFSFIVMLLIAATISTPVVAQPKVIDKVVAVVGDVAISSRELAMTVARVRENLSRQEQQIPPPDVLVANVLEQLIVVKLQLQEAKRLGIAVDEVALDSMLVRIAENNGQTLAEMKAQIEQQQGSYSEMRESVRQELIISQLRQQVVDGIQVSDAEIETSLRELNAKTLFRFSYLSAELPEIETEREKLRLWFQQLRKKMLYENDFSKLAKAASKNASVSYKKSEPRRLKQLPELLQAKVLNMNIGDVTQIIKTADRIYLFSLDDKQAEQQPRMVEQQYHIRHILLRTDAMNSDSYIRKKLLAIKKRIENGESFELLAKRYSQDPGSGFKGGDLGWLPTQGLAKEFAQQVEQATHGQVIGPFATEFGQHLLEVLGERKQDISGDIQRQNIIAQLRREKSAEAINEWLLRLRESQHIDIRL
ncbi:MAG: peptidylprolyl isomerase [Chromatiales bacterium]|nr:peptidylprolyl isomerase [Chromatiales bacterium]